MPIIISGDPTKSISLTGDQSKSIQASQVVPPPPAYVIDGLEQSHWDVANAVVSGGLVTSIPDSSNVQALTPIVLSGVTAVKATYAASGWSLNGKTLPTATFAQGVVNSGQFCMYQANLWASKMQSYSGAMTVAMLVKPSYAGTQSSQTAQWGSPWGWGNRTSQCSQGGPGADPFGRDTWAFYRSVALGDEFRFLAGSSASTSPQLWMVEYTNVNTGLNNFRFWINGALQSETSWSGSFPAGQTLPSLEYFTVGGFVRETGPVTSTIPYFAMNMAQAHIWKGALTDQQRTDVTAYLKSISGIA